MKQFALLITALLMLFTLASFPAAAQLVGTDTVPGSSCAGYPNGATRMTADADLDGAQVILVCDGTTWNAVAGGGGSCTTDIQTFDNSGTWTKPACGSTVKIECWAGGGGSSRNYAGGGGGEGDFIILPSSDFGATETVTIGSGGTASGQYGAPGGDSSFGSVILVKGGDGASTSVPGVGGGDKYSLFPGYDGATGTGGSGGSAGYNRNGSSIVGRGGDGGGFGQEKPGEKGQCIITTW